MPERQNEIARQTQSLLSVLCRVRKPAVRTHPRFHSGERRRESLVQLDPYAITSSDNGTVTRTETGSSGRRVSSLAYLVGVFVDVAEDRIDAAEGARRLRRRSSAVPDCAASRAGARILERLAAATEEPKEDDLADAAPAGEWPLPTATSPFYPVLEEAELRRVIRVGRKYLPDISQGSENE